MQFVCRFVPPDLSFLVSDSGLGNADKTLASLLCTEGFADLQGAQMRVRGSVPYFIPGGCCDRTPPV